jgi:toxin FitB
MRYLLDTNVLSEFKRPTPNAMVLSWLSAANEEELYISVVSLGELRQGVEQLADGRRKTELDRWLRDELPGRFEGRVLEVNAAVADVWGELSAKVKRQGLSVGVVDRYLAAAARVHAMAIVTRNTKDFRALDVNLVNPWHEEVL